MSLLMTGTIDDVFQSVPATRSVNAGSYVDGIWQDGASTSKDYKVTIQPANDREIDFVRNAGERITDVRKIYINDKNMDDIDQTGTWEFSGQQWKAVQVDCRPWRDYCKVLVVRIDD